MRIKYRKKAAKRFLAFILVVSILWPSGIMQVFANGEEDETQQVEQELDAQNQDDSNTENASNESDEASDDNSEATEAEEIENESDEQIEDVDAIDEEQALFMQDLARTPLSDYIRATEISNYSNIEVVTSESEFATAITNGATAIILESDINVSSALTHSGDLTIFGEGYKLSFTTATARINLSGRGSLKVYDLEIIAATASPLAINNGAGVFCANVSTSGTWEADFYSISFTGASLIGSNVTDSYSMPNNYFEAATFHEENTLVAKDYRGLNAVVFAQNVTIEGTFDMTSETSINTSYSAGVGNYFRSPGAGNSASEYSTGARGTHAASGTFEVAADANVTISRSPIALLNGTNVYIDYLQSVIYGYKRHIFGEGSSFDATANTNRNIYEDGVSDANGNAANYRSAIIRSEAATDFIVAEGAEVTLETDEWVAGTGYYGFTALLLRKDGNLNFQVKSGATLSVTARGNYGDGVVSARARAPIMIMGKGNSTVNIAGTMNISSENANGWYYAYGTSGSSDVFNVTGAVYIQANGAEGYRVSSGGTTPDEYAAFEHYNDNVFTLNIMDGGLMRINATGWRAMSLAASTLAANPGKIINVKGSGSQLLINPDDENGEPGGYVQFAIAAEGRITFNLNVTDGGEMYARNTQDSNIYTVGTANYNVSGSGSKLTLIKTGENSTKSTQYSLYGAIFHDTTGPLNISVNEGGYMYVESSYGSRATICAQSYGGGMSDITVDGNGSELIVINNNTDIRHVDNSQRYIEDSALYPIGAIAFAANTSGNITVSNGANFYAESHNAISPTIALGAYASSSSSGVFTANNPGEIDIRNDGTIANSSGTVDIRGIALRGRDNYYQSYYYISNLGSGRLYNSSDAANTLDVINSEITVYERNGGKDTVSFENWEDAHIIRHWSNTSFHSMNVGTTSGVTNTNGSSGTNGSAVSAASTATATDFTLQDYGRIYIRGTSSSKQVSASSQAGVNGAEVKIGDVITYEISYINNYDAVSNLVITDTLPSGLKYISHETGDATSSSYDSATSTITWNANNIASGASGTVTVVAEVTSQASGSVTNSAKLDWTFVGGSTATQEPNVTNPVASTSTKYVSVNSQAGVNGAVVRLGDQITYEIAYVNNTGSTASVTITDTLPTGVTYVSSDGSYDDVKNMVSWSFTDIAAGAGGIVTITVEVTDVSVITSITNEATITWNGDDSNPENPEVVNPVGASKYVDDESEAGQNGGVVTEGDTITYMIRYVNNTGEDNATVEITDVLPEVLTYEANSATSATNISFTQTGNTLIWTITGVDAGASGEVSFKATVGNISGISYITNQADLLWKTSSGNEIPDEAENTNPAVNPTGSLKYVAADSQAGVDGAAVHVGDIITYEIKYINSTGATANLTITDTLPTGVTYLSSTDNGSYDDSVVTWSISNVLPNEVGTVTVTVQVNTEATTAIKNTADLEWDTGNGNPDTESPSVVNPIGSSKYLSKVNDEASESGRPVKVGDTLTYTISYVNNTGAEAALKITDTLASGLSYVDSSGDGAYSNGVVTWDINNVAAGNSGYVTVTVTVNEAAFGTIVNGAELTWTPDGGDTEKEKPETENPVSSSKYVSGSSSAGADGTPIRIGDEVTYVIHYSNLTGTASDVTITDVLPTQVEYVSHTGDGNYDATTGTITWNLSNIAAGAYGKVSVTVRIVSVVDASDNLLTSITNTATITWDSDSNNPETPEVEVPVGASKYVSDTSAAGQNGAAVSVGDVIEYVITYVNNTGENNATVTITDELPMGLTYVTGSATTGTNIIVDDSSNPLTWRITGVDAGESGSVSFKATVNANLSGISLIINKAELEWITSGGSSIEEVENTNPAINPTASVKYLATVNGVNVSEETGTVVYPGDLLRYEISYVNSTGASTLTITDILDDGMEFVSASDGGMHDASNDIITWENIPVTANASGTVSVIVRVTADAGVKLVNKAELAWDGTTSDNSETTNPLGSSKYVSTDSEAGVDGAAVYVGDIITYDIHYVNNTGIEADLEIIDALPTGVEYVSSEPAASDIDGDITWTINNVGAGEGGKVTVTVRVTEEIVGSTELVNTATLKWDKNDGNPETETPSVVNPVGSSKYISARNDEEGSYQSLQIGDVVTYTIYYVNNTGAEATVQITDDLHAGLAYQASSEGGIYNIVNHIVVWTIENVEAGGTGSVTVTLLVTEDVEATVINEAKLVWTDGTEESPSVETDIASSKYVLIGSAGENGSTVYIGDEITYVIHYVNSYDEVATLTITDVLQNGLEYVSHTEDNNVTDFTQVDNTLTWTLNVPAKTSGDVTVTVRVTKEVGASVTNEATLSWESGNDSSTETPSTTNPVGATKLIESGAGADGAKLEVGDQITYTIWYVNKGESPADLTITDTLEDGLRYVSDTGDATRDGNVITWNIYNVDAGATGYVTVTVEVTAQASGYVTNAATLVWNESEEETPPEVVNPISSVKYVDENSNGAGGTPVAIGDVITYTIVYVNNYDVNAFVTVTDKLDSTLEYVSSTPEATIEVDGTLTWSDILVSAGQYGSIELTVRVTAEAAEKIEVVNRAQFAWKDLNSGELEEEESTAVNPLQSSKFISNVNDGNVVALQIGDEVTYSIHYINNTGEISSATIVDKLPEGMEYVRHTNEDDEISSTGYDVGENTVTWAISEVAIGGDGTVTVTLRVTDQLEASEDGKVVNAATITWTAENAEPENPTTEDEVALYTINYDPNEGTGGISIYNVIGGTVHGVYTQSQAMVSRSGYTFLGWGTSQTSGVVYTDTDTIQINSDITLYAQWRSNGGGGGETTTYYVSYLANGGTGSHTDSGLTYNSSYTVRTQSATGIAYENKTFAGWNTRADGNGTSYAVGYSFSITSNLTLYAQWKDQLEGETFTVTYHANGGTGSYADGGIAAGTSYRILSESSVGISRSGYTFLGWNTSADGSGSSYYETNHVTINEDLALYAQWRRNNSGGGGETNELITLEDDIPPLATFSTDHFAYVIGYPDGYVRPENNILRSEVTTIFFRLLNASVRYDYWGTVNNYSDVELEAWYNNSVSVMTNLGVISGYPDGSFGPQDNITRAELAAIAARFAKLNGTTASTSLSFSDISGHWAEDYILYAASVGWINGYTDGSFHPDEYITRAEFIAIVNRMLERTPESTSDLLANMITWPDNADTTKWYYLDIQEATNSHYYEMKETLVPGRGYYYERWTTLREAPNWSVLEKPDSEPYDLVIGS